ncbi:hypothetical protein IWQ61_007149 [Dispira simplex]|nr:hypothetical protein IWQ61_007149 [Dispira simplex]
MGVVSGFILLLLVAVQAALGIQFEITSPFRGAGWIPGKNTQVTYNVLPDDKRSGVLQKGQVISAVLLRKATENPEFTMLLAKEVDIRQGFIPLKVPSLASREDYFIAIGYGKNWNYSGRFEIINPSAKVNEQINRKDADYFYGIYDIYNPSREGANKKRTGTATSDSGSSTTESTRGTLRPGSGASVVEIASTTVVGLTLTVSALLAWY